MDLERHKGARGNRGKKKKLFLLGLDGSLQPRVLLGRDRKKLPGHKRGILGLELEGGGQELPDD